MTRTTESSARDTLASWLERRGLQAEWRETHASVVALTADRVFKIKKPVRFDFLDLSTPRRRLEVCGREVELNRRLAPDTYLGVIDITDEAGHVVDHAVEMVRLPDDRRLDVLLQHDGTDCVRQVAQVMAAFHRTAARSPQISEVGSPAGMHRLWRAEIAGLAPFAGSIVDGHDAEDAEYLAGAYIAGRAELFARRVATGRICDGHGDLRADDVFCKPEGLDVIDCLEFDDKLRWGDVLGDIGFLAMDLEWLGHARESALLLSEYRQITGDDWPVSLMHHWLAYRAHVRSKVACLRTLAGADATESARGHLALAVRHLRAAQVRLVLVGGLPGTGKSTLARGLAERTGMILLRSDVIRQEASAPDSRSVVEGVGEGRYSRANRDAVYNRMLVQAGQLLAEGHSLVLDATWSDASNRHRAAAVAKATARALDPAEMHCAGRRGGTADPASGSRGDR